jgi:DNA-binding CsgD family transcriptional regulator
MEVIDKVVEHYKDGCSNEKYSLDEQIRKFTNASTPDEISYLVHGSSVEVIPLNSSNSNGIEVRKLENLYDHINVEQEDRVLDFFANKLTKFGFRKEFSFYDSVYGFVYKTKNNRIVHKRTGISLLSDEGKVLSTYGKIIDVTDWVHPKQAFKWYASGKNAEDFYAFVNEISEFKEILSQRELEVLNYVSKGYTSRQIADTLFISKSTVDTHRKNIINKLEVKGSIEAVNKAEEIGILK